MNHLSLVLTFGSATVITAVAALDSIPPQRTNSLPLDNYLGSSKQDKNLQPIPSQEAYPNFQKNSLPHPNLSTSSLPPLEEIHELVALSRERYKNSSNQALFQKSESLHDSSLIPKSLEVEETSINIKILPNKKDKKNIKNQSLSLNNSPQDPQIYLNKISNKNKQNPSEIETIIPDSREEVSLTLADVVALAIANNRDIKNAYLDRIVDRAELAEAEAIFLPKVTPRLEGEISGNGIESIENTRSELNLGAGVSISMPTGAEVTVNWETDLASSETSILNDSSLGQNLRVTLSQPLLRDGGIAVNTAPQKISFINEEINILNLKQTLINTITTAIVNYRSLLQAQESVKIQESALENAKSRVERAQALIDAGRLARLDIIQTQADVATFEVNLIQAQNNLESTKLRLIDTLDIDQNLNIVAIETPKLDSFELNPAELQTFMFANRPEYLQSKLQQEIAKLTLLQAENNRLWDFDLTASYNNSSGSNEDFRAGLVLSRELNDRTSESRFERSRVNLLQAENNLAGLEEELKIELTDSIRDLELSYRQVELAIQARKLAEDNLEIEQTRRQFGRSDFFQISDLQTALVNAQNAEQTAIINYANARTQLDQLLGNTLNTWGIRVEN